MNSNQAIVYVVDDDESIRTSTKRLLQSLGLAVETFESAREFLDSPLPDCPGCVILDVRMPGLSGIELQAELKRAGCSLPIIFRSAHGDVPMTAEAMKAGAFDFLPKPVREQTLLDAVQRAIGQHRQLRDQEREVEALRLRIQSLTDRERDVLRLVVEGKLNKQIAAALGIAEATVKIHRRRVMDKMEADSLAALVRFVDRVEAADSSTKVVPPWPQ